MPKPITVPPTILPAGATVPPEGQYGWLAPKEPPNRPDRPTMPVERPTNPGSETRP